MTVTLLRTTVVLKMVDDDASENEMMVNVMLALTMMPDVSLAKQPVHTNYVL